MYKRQGVWINKSNLPVLQKAVTIGKDLVGRDLTKKEIIELYNKVLNNPDSKYICLLYTSPEDTNYAKINFSDNVVVAANNGSDEKWIKDNNEDSKVKYYYYNTILQPNVETKEIINSVTVNIPDEIEKRFRGKKLVIDVKAETVLATEEAYKAAWSDIDNPDISAMLDNLCRN